jgi:hypothetical protein
MEPFFGDHLHLSAQQILKILSQSDAVQQAALRLKLDEEIDVAIRPGLASRYGAEQTDIMSTVLDANSEDLAANIGAEVLHWRRSFLDPL